MISSFILVLKGCDTMENTISESIFTDADKLIAFLTDLAVNKNNVFRGYGKQSELLPSLIREKDWSNQEINLLFEFEKYGLQYFSANNPIDFMSYAQHYGLPTRLLDFTYNPFTALSFALFMPKSTKYTYNEDRTYYYIRYCNLNQHICFRSLPYYDSDTIFQSGSFASKCSKMISALKRIVDGLEEEYDNDDDTGVNAIISYFRSIYSEKSPDMLRIDSKKFKPFLDETTSKLVERRPLFLDVNQCNQRIVMQQGLFLFPYTLNPDEHLDIIHSNTSVVKIHKDIRDDLLDYLDTIGLNSFRLMPDLQSVCNAVKRKIVEERQATSTLFKKRTALCDDIDNSDTEAIHNLLVSAFEKYKQTSGYANIAPVGAYIKKLQPNFDVRNYGFTKLSEFIENYPDRYKIIKDTSAKVPIAKYKCL